ncbi:MAG: Bax inhibitor-1/YccA family protein [Candidatus Izemoplasmataceae bacterium]
MRMRSSNPVYKYGDFTNSGTDTATYSGVVIKTGILLAIIAGVAMYFGSTLDFTGDIGGAIFTIILAPIVAIIMVIMAHRNTQMAWAFSLIYAAAEGIFLGFISGLYAYLYGNDIVLTALVATFGVLSAMLFLYSSGVIRVGTTFRRFMMSALFGLIGASLFLFIFAIFGGLNTQIGYSLYVGIVLISVVVSSLFLLVDFDNVTKLVNAGASKDYEWSLSLGLVVTIVWLYIELLRLIAIIAGDR